MMNDEARKKVMTMQIGGFILNDVLQENVSTEVRLPEAVALMDKHQRISSAFRSYLYKKRTEEPIDNEPRISYWSLYWDMYVFENYLVAKSEGRYYKFTFTTTADGYSFEGPFEVEIEFSTKLGEADVSIRFEEEDFAVESSWLHEAASGTKTGKEWEVVVIKAGMSKNGRNYPASVLKEAVSKFDGVPVYADHQTEKEAVERPERSVNDKVGKVVKPRFVESTGEVRATLKVINPAYQTLLKEAYDQNEMDFVGLSIDARGTTEYKSIGSQRYLEVTDLTKVKSVDVVTLPAAGGKLTRLVAGMSEDDNQLNEGVDEVQTGDEEIMTLAQLAALLKEAQTNDPDGYKAFVATLTPEQKEAVEAPTNPVQESVRVELPANYNEIVEKVQLMESQNRTLTLTNRVNTLISDYSSLSDFAKTKLRESFVDLGNRREFTDDEFKVEADAWVAQEAKYTNGQPSVVREGQGASVGMDQNERFNLAMRGLIVGEAQDGVEPFRHIREAYIRMVPNADILDDPMTIMGSLFTAYDSKRDSKRIKESITSSTFAEIFNDNMHFAMMKEYNESDLFAWQKLASDITSVSDFRTNHVARMGDYDTIEAVGEGETYQAIATPGDEEITFTVRKYGNLEDLTMESLLADRVGALSRIPRKLGRAAARTAYNFFMQLITTTNPTMPYDSVALYHNTHTNTGTSPFSLSALNATNVAMRRKQAFGSSDYLGSQNRVKYVIAQSAQEALINRVINPSGSFIYALNQQVGHADSGTSGTGVNGPDTANILDPEMFKGANIEFFEYEALDSNDWYAVADPRKVPTFIAAFLNGRREPELFTQSDPTNGSVFTADKITYKVRFIFGGAMQDHRTVYRHAVT